MNRFLALLIAAFLAGCAVRLDGVASGFDRVTYRALSPSDFAIKVDVGGGQWPSLRPLLAKRAEQLAAANGAAGFLMAEPRLHTELGDSTVANAIVRLVQSEPTVGNKAVFYSLARLRTQDASRSQAELQGTAELLAPNSTAEGTGSLRVWPVFFDIAAFKKDSYPYVYAVHPGDQFVVCFASYSKSLLSPRRLVSVALRADLKPGQAYRIRGHLVDSAVSVWIENAATGERVTESKLPVD